MSQRINKQSWKNFDFEAHYELPKQMDGHNCGIFIYMVTLDKSKSIGNEFDPIRCRLKIFDDSNGGISPLLKAQRNRQIFTVNLEQEIAKGIGREELLKIDLFWKNKCFLGLTENGLQGNDESLQNLQSIITSNYNALERKEIISKDFAPFGQWYKGFKLDAAWLQKHHSELKAIKLGSRKSLKCKLCYDNISEAKKYARNGTVPIADGVRCDGMQQLQRIIDHLKVDVHNDSVTKTLSAWSWPSRSLAQMHAENQVKQYIDHGLDRDFVAFNPPQSALHYRNPDRYREILSFVSKHELSRVIQALKIADCVALQIEKSVDKYNADSLFTARYMDNTNFEMKDSFLGECHSELRGVIGMVDALQKRFQYLEIEDVIKAKMCIAHRFDLAFESVENVVPEFRHWLTDVKNVATYFRESSYRQENLHEIAASLGETAKHFPRHHEVRFAEHLANVILAVLSNHQMMCAYWKTVVQQGENNEKQRARGFLKDWSQTSFNLNMSAVALDILRFTKRSSTHRNVKNLYVTTHNRNFEAVRLEVITCAKNFLERRLDVDQDLQVKAIIDVANAENAEAMIKAELKSDLRSSMSRNTVNDRLFIALNAIGTANFDPRPVVADFLSSKTRRSTLPDDELYRNR
ncbi:hypothetical protein HELRODRAFT_184362 [Helobdella robusta]|uniref:Uncharacterized protein n=1 Tax=Helobdella robusta TaxID=6412 RepID=T1FL19_HELRO|nr:hypothetical protein HELRODRAFT_184362 [Helobdella robusta]ESO00140.1 hypothetical protein HELRODRAFT_184362 [Helobdella robusta]